MHMSVFFTISHSFSLQMNTITRRNIVERYIEARHSKSFEEVVDTVLSQHQVIYNHKTTLPPPVISTLKSEFKKRWKRAYGMKDRFYKNYSDWLEKELKLGVNAEEENEDEEEEEREGRRVLCGGASCSDAGTSRGRSPVDFENGSDRTKRRKTQDIRRDCSAEQLLYAAEMKLRKEGKKDAAMFCKEAYKNSSTKAKKVATKINATHASPFEPCKALSLMLNMNMSKSNYVYLRNTHKEVNCNLYPSYKKVLEAKKATYPSDISFTQGKCEVPLQNLLDHTTSRLLLSQRDALQLFGCTPLSLQLVTKYGFDGSGSQSLYAMKVDAGQDICETNLFASFICPIKLIVKDTNTIIWHNPTPSSTRYCRPLRLQFVKETEDVIRSEHASIKREIDDLQPYVEGDITVYHTLILTMVDGKVCQVLSGTPSSSTCFMCHPKTNPSRMNNIEEIKRKETSLENIKFGLSPLHLYINTMECVLHIAYRMKLKTWCVKGERSKAIMAAEKKRIQRELKQELGINVDLPAQGSGNTNNGNSARRFFSEASKSSVITNVDEQLIKRFSVILSALNSGHNINIERYKTYAEETAQLYVDLYNWYYMPVSVHKMLIHGASVIESLIIPVGQASEEAIEARHKDIRNVRLSHTCKISRERVNQDLLQWMLATSDPLVASYRKPRNRKPETSLAPQVLYLLKEPDVDVRSDDNSDGNNSVNPADDNGGDSDEDQ